MDQSQGFWSGLFSGQPFMPHRHCYAGQDDLILVHVISDTFIAAAYYSIPIILFAFVWKRRDIPFNWLFVMFGMFILACGTTHIMEIITVWEPVYRLSGLVKAWTALISVATALLLVPIIPKALALPSLASSNQRLQQTTAELIRSNQELEQFAYVASHDLQEPLRMVTMFMDLVRKNTASNVDPKITEYMAFASEGAQRMRLLIDDLLAYSRIERSEAKAEHVDSGASLAAAMQNLQVKINETGTRITHDHLPTVKFQRTQLIEVFQNLLGNAIKFGAQGDRQVHVSAARGDKEWIFSVRDNGIGIEPAHQERIFEIFQRLHSRKDYPGTGIGLAVCKKIVERHGGRIWVRSQFGAGATFSFTIPDGDASSKNMKLPAPAEGGTKPT